MTLGTIATGTNETSSGTAGPLAIELGSARSARRATTAAITIQSSVDRQP